MSKLYALNRMTGAPAAGGLIGSIVKFGAKVLGIGKKVAPVVGKLAKNPMVQTGAMIAAGSAASALLDGGGGSGGASGGWTGRRRGRGITARELRGYRKVANLLHKEGMVSKRARRGK
jgi:hypothetical protein